MAVKLLREHLTADSVVAARFQNEAQTAATFQHPSIVAVLDHGQDGDALYTVMELVDDGSLGELIRARAPLSVPEALSLMQGILEALEVIHRKHVVHRDVKPANILLTSEGTPKLGDFGIARAAYAGHLTRTGLTLGTAAYMAPEQALGDTLGPATDLYAAGVILFELLTGELPFQGDDPLQVMYRQVHERPPVPHTLNPAIPAALSAALLRALDKDPSRRYADAREMWNALNHAKDVASPEVRTTEIRHLRSFAGFAPNLMRLRPMATSLLAAGVMLMAGVLGLSAFSRGASISATVTPAATTLTSPWVGAAHRRTATAAATMPPMIVGADVSSAGTGVPTPTPETAEAPTSTPVPTSAAPTPTPQSGIVSGPIVRNDAPEQPTPQPTADASAAPTATTDQPSSPPSKEPKEPKDPKDQKSSKDSKGPPSKDQKGSKDSKPAQAAKGPTIVA